MENLFDDDDDVFLGNEDSNLRSAATSEFDEDFAQSMDVDNDDADDEDLDEDRSNGKVCI